MYLCHKNKENDTTRFQGLFHNRQLGGVVADRYLIVSSFTSSQRFQRDCSGKAGDLSSLWK